MENQMKTANGKIPKREISEKQRSGKSRNEKSARKEKRENPGTRNQRETAIGKIPKAESDSVNRENAEKSAEIVEKNAIPEITVSEIIEKKAPSTVAAEVLCSESIESGKDEATAENVKNLENAKTEKNAVSENTASSYSTATLSQQTFSAKNPNSRVARYSFSHPRSVSLFPLSVSQDSLSSFTSPRTAHCVPCPASRIPLPSSRVSCSSSPIPLRAQSLSVGYGKRIIISNINLAVEGGKIVTLIGPNGSGKSTLLKTLANEISSLGGKVFLLGKNMSSLSEKEIAPHLSILMTERLKSGKMTCREVVATGRYPYTGRLGLLSPEDWKKTDEAISLVHAEEVANSLFSEISDGQRQRIMLARAVAQDTEVIILDEPTSFLDLRHKIDLMKIIRALARRQKKAVVLSLHELELVKIVSDIVVCLDGKKIVRNGSPSEIFSGNFINRLYSLSDSEFAAEKCRLNLNFDEKKPQKNPENEIESKNAETENKTENQPDENNPDVSFQDKNIQKIHGGPAQCAVAMSEVPPSASLLRSRLPHSLRNASRLFQRCRNESSARGNQKIPQTKNQKLHRTKVIMVQGTMSNAGKSFLVAGLCRVFAQDGYRVSPFKSQNMALNSFVTKDGLEMGRAQVMQAEAAGVEPSVFMNPILLKPTTDSGSQVIVNGEVFGNMSAREYFKFKKSLVPQIVSAFQKLEETSDIIVIEGAGSPAEINLRENDIVNMGLAEIFGAPVILAADIDRGGVFAQLLGTAELLSKSERSRIKGFVINKFRGDVSLLESGIKAIEKKTKIPCAGTMPYLKISLDDEDSLSSRFEKKDFSLVNLAVVKLPRISNFTDFDVFEQIPGVSLNYISSKKDFGNLDDFDLVFLPGSKNTIGDLKWLKENGFDKKILEFAEKKPVFGICGGYQILGKSISDPENVEEGGEILGLSLLDTKTVLKKEKTRVQIHGKVKIGFGAAEISRASPESPAAKAANATNSADFAEKSFFGFISGKNFEGYEIHNGESEIGENSAPILVKKSTDFVSHSDSDEKLEKKAGISESCDSESFDSEAKGAVSGNAAGTYIHGFFDGGLAFSLAQKIALKKGSDLRNLQNSEFAGKKSFGKDFSGQTFRDFKESQYNLLADEIRKNLDMDAIYKMLAEAKV